MQHKHLRGWNQLRLEADFLRKKTVRRLAWRAVSVLVMVTTVLQVNGVGVFAPSTALAAPASIWTTRTTCVNPDPQDENEYFDGDTVYIRGSNFIASTQYFWTINGQPGSADPGNPADPSESPIASGTVTTDADGYFCLGAYVIGSDGDVDAGVYTVDVSETADMKQSKNDNYHVDAVEEEPGSLTVTKTVVGGSLSADDVWLTISPDPNDVSPVQPSNGSYTFTDLPAGTYTVTEAMTDGYIQSVADCADVEVAAGEVSTCDITNTKTTTTIKAWKVVCEFESDLPNWGDGSGTDYPGKITATTAQDYVNSHPGCALQPDWQFQWGYMDKPGTAGVNALDGAHIGLADGSVCTGIYTCGPNTLTGTGYSDWKTFPTTTEIGTPAEVTIEDFQGAPGVWVREVLPNDSWVPFSTPPAGLEDVADVSAEIYCHDDLINYDNYDYAAAPQGMEYMTGQTFGNASRYCVAFNALKEVEEPEETTVTVLKNVDTNGDGQVDVFGSTDWTWDLNAGNQNFATGTTQVIQPGQISLNEDMQAGYEFVSVSCAVNQDPFEVTQSTSVSFETFEGGNYVCTFTNRLIPVTNIALDKTGPASVNPGNQIIYNLAWSVTGNTSATNATITDSIPDNTTFVSATNGGTFAAGVVTWNLGTQAPGANGLVSVTVTVSPNLTQPTTLVNTGTFDTDQNTPVNDTVNTNVLIPQVLGEETDPALTITKSVDPSVTNPGKTVTYTVIVSSVGTEDAVNVVVTDSLPTGFTFVDGGGSTKTWTFATLAMGASQTITYDVLVGQNVTKGTYTNVAVVTANQVTPISAEASIEVRVPQVLGLATTGMGLRDYLVFSFGLSTLLAGLVLIRRRQLGLE